MTPPPDHARHRQARSAGALLQGPAIPGRSPRGRDGRRRGRLRRDVASDRLPRSAGPRGRDRHPAVERGRPVGDRRGRLPAAAAPDPRRGRGLLPRRSADRAVRRSLRPRHRRRLPEAGGDPAAGRGPAPGADGRRAGQPPAGRAADSQPAAAGPRLGRAPCRRADLRRRHVQPRPAAAPVARPPVPAGGLGHDAGALPDRLRRVARRRPDLQAAADPGAVADAGDVRAARSGGRAGGAGSGLGRHHRPGGGGGGAALRRRHRRRW